MIKGIGKQVVLLNNTDSEIFEQAIFILRRNNKIPHNDLVKECERMINTHIKLNKRGKEHDFWKIGFFAMSGVSLILGIFCLI